MVLCLDTWEPQASNINMLFIFMGLKPLEAGHSDIMNHGS